LASGRERDHHGLVLELGIEVLVLGDHLLEQCPVDGIPAGLVLDVAHLDQAVGALQDEFGLLPGIDDGWLLSSPAAWAARPNRLHPSPRVSTVAAVAFTNLRRLSSIDARFG
jgi:hypothetical protein